MSRTVKHPNACGLPRCGLCHMEKKSGNATRRTKPNDRQADTEDVR